jgi:DNA-binding LacI/PurR family transcriptional regulator
MNVGRAGKRELSQRRVTISDIAEAAGVSTATASHALSGRRPVSPEAAENVRRAVAALGYTPNATARALASGRSFVLAMYMPFAPDELTVSPFFAASIVSISTAISEHGYALLMLPSEPGIAETHARSLIAARRIDGALMLDPDPADEIVAAAFDDLHVPLVTVGKLKGRVDGPWVDGDVVAQFTDALDHLYVRGYRRPALVTFPGEQSFLCEAEAAYREWCASVDRTPIVFKTASVVDESPDRCVGELATTDFDSVLCADDMLASSILIRLRTLGITQVGVVGTGDSRHARESTPPLTSIATHAVDRGRHAAQLLLDLIDDKKPARLQITIPHELIVRESTPAVDVTQRHLRPPSNP